MSPQPGKDRCEQDGVGYEVCPGSAHGSIEAVQSNISASSVFVVQASCRLKTC